MARDLNLPLIRMSRSGRTGRRPREGRLACHGPPASSPPIRAISAVGQNYRRELAADPTDEQYFKSEWGLHNKGQTISGIEPQTGMPDVDIDGLEALRVQQGKPSVVVAVIDDGVDFSHPDLAGTRVDQPRRDRPATASTTTATATSTTSTAGTSATTTRRSTTPATTATARTSPERSRRR